MLGHSVLDPGYTMLNKTVLVPVCGLPREQSDLTQFTTSSQIVIRTEGKDHIFANIESKLFGRDLLWARSCPERWGM